MILNDTSQAIVIILAIFLALFLILAIILLGVLIKVMRQIQSITLTVQDSADKVNGILDGIAKIVAPAAAAKMANFVLERVLSTIRASKKSKKDEE